jgi:multidrug resistance efflux pump
MTLKKQAALLLLLLAFLASGCAGSAASAQSEVITPQVQADSAAFTIPGRLAPREYSELSLAHGRGAEAVLVNEGEHVAPGQALIRLDGYEAQAKQLADAQRQLILAQQALDDLYRSAGSARAKAELELRQAEDAQAFAEDHLAGLLRPKSKLQIEQTHANMLLAEKQLDMKRDDLRKAEQKFKNKDHIIWWFINKRQFKLRLTALRKQVANYERRYIDAQEKYNDLIAPPDEIDVAVAQAELAAADARLDQAQRQLDELAGGPDPDLVEIASARLKAAEAQLAAEKRALDGYTLLAPIGGVIASLNVKNGEWIQPIIPAVVIRGDGGWVVESDELKETDLPRVEVGQAVNISVDAYPDLALRGEVESIDLYPVEDDEDVLYNVRLRLAESDPRLRWGMSADVEFGE